MIKTAKFMAWSLGTLIVLAGAAWLYMGGFGRQEAATGPQGPSVESGIALFKSKKYKEAVSVFESIPPGGEREWYTRYYQGSAYIMLKDYPAAVSTLEQALALNNSETRIMHALGVAYYKLGNLKLSKAYFAAVLEIDPGNDEAKGLMDIMASLERQQPGAQPPDTAEPEEETRQ